MQEINTQQLYISENTKLDDIVKELITVVCEISQIRQLCQFLKISNVNNKLQLIKKQDQFYLFYLLNPQQNETQIMKTLEKVIHLGDHILSIGIDNNLQSIIQKKYLTVLDQSYRLDPNRKLTMSFVHQHHKKTSTFRGRIRYFKQLTVQCLPTQKNKSAILTVGNIKDIYNYSTQPNRYNVCKVKLTYQKMMRIKNIQSNFGLANKKIFEDNVDRRKLQKYINQMKLPKKLYQHLLWKSHQVQVFQNIMEQIQDNTKDYYRELKFDELGVDIVNSGIQILDKKWSKNSFSDLKELFDKIANHKDYKGIQQFNNKCNKYQSNLQKIYQKVQNYERKTLIKLMINQLTQFIQYHNCVIKGPYLSAFKYYKQQAKYLWKYRRQVYKKLAAFILIIILSLLQTDLIKGITILSIGVIFLSIRI